eukprot:15484665-Alexandrium_andersonii.AAC.1
MQGQGARQSAWVKLMGLLQTLRAPRRSMGSSATSGGGQPSRRRIPDVMHQAGGLTPLFHAASTCSSSARSGA